MKAKNLLLVMVLIISGTIPMRAQTADTLPKSLAQPVAIDRNLIKLNITSLFFMNFMLQYERVINKPISAALSVRLMPNTTLPYKNFIFNRYGDDDPNTKETLDNIRMDIFSISPEVRFYLNKKGFGEGFYIAPFYMYSKSAVDNVNYKYENDEGEEQSINMSGNITANTGGILLGRQWLIGKLFCLDWWFFGPLFGKEKGSLSGISTQPMTPEEQDDLEQNLNDIDIPKTTITADVYSNGANMTSNGIWGGFRFGVSFGVRF